MRISNINIRYALIITGVITIEIMLIFSFLYKPVYNDVTSVLTYKETAEHNYKEYLKFISDQTKRESKEAKHKKDLSPYEIQLKDSGLVNIQEVDPDIMVGLRYSSKNNFVGIDMYGDLDNCYLQKDVAAKLALASKYLHEKCSYYNLKVLDGVRPLHIQRMMWDSVKMPWEEKMKYVSPPSYGSLHNYGAAVDITIVNYEGWESDMGTDFDFFGELGYPSQESRMISEGKLTYRQRENRALLREVMYKAGFSGIPTEWWHFNSCSIEEARSKYHLVN